MSNARGQIEKSKDILGDVFYKVFTGCKHLNDYYTVDTLEHAETISKELKGVN